MPSVLKAVKRKGAPLHKCWAFIDGTARAICRPRQKQQQEAYYSGYKSCHCVKYQSAMALHGPNCLRCPAECTRHRPRRYLGLPTSYAVPTSVLPPAHDRDGNGRRKGLTGRSSCKRHASAHPAWKFIIRRQLQSDVHPLNHPPYITSPSYISHRASHPLQVASALAAVTTTLKQPYSQTTLLLLY
ncbi:uncharacterized protein [Dermacentor albipictus]|uniref:uncharacterized protein n=1 Tax=Dermacentor albipictus TaxID=60249 RepID=UPI0038FC84C2